jgi:hypothetical protein
MRHTRCFLLAVLLLVVPAAQAAEDTTDVGRPHRIEMRDGSVFIGHIVAQDADSLRFMTLSGIVMTIPRPRIEKIVPLEGVIEEGQFHRVDPNRSRLLFGPTARPVRSGGGYIAFYELFFPFVAFGVGDILTVSGGLSLFPGATDQLFYLGPKISIPTGTESAQLAVGLQYANAFGGGSSGAGILYGATTLGNPFTSVTFGAGWGFSGEDFSDKPVILAGFEAQVSGSAKFILENWIPVTGDVSVHAFGIRLFGDELAADFALVYVRSGTSPEGFPFIPWIGFVYNFGGSTGPE